MTLARCSAAAVLALCLALTSCADVASGLVLIVTGINHPDPPRK